MKRSILNFDALERIRKIHKVSLSYNRKVGKGHQGRLLELMRKHIEEIEDLNNKGDEHFLVETGDLIILCFELLIESGVNIDDILRQCFKRYEFKLNELLEKEDNNL